MTIAKKPTPAQFVAAAPVQEQGRRALKSINMNFEIDYLERLDRWSRELRITRQALVMLAVGKYLESNGK